MVFKYHKKLKLKFFLENLNINIIILVRPLINYIIDIDFTILLNYVQITRLGYNLDTYLIIL